MAQFFAHGGLFMYLVLLAGILGVVVSVLQLVLARKIDLVPLIVGFVLITLIMGGLGSALGITTAFSAVSAVDPSMKAAMLAAGISEALSTTTLGLLMALLQTILGAIAATVHRNKKRT